MASLQNLSAITEGSEISWSFILKIEGSLDNFLFVFIASFKIFHVCFKLDFDFSKLCHNVNCKRLANLNK